MRYSQLARAFHYCMLFVVLYQMIGSIWMTAPEPGKIVSWEMIVFSLHVWLFGWAAFLLGGAYVMIKSRDRDELGRLYPWFSAKRRAAFFASAREEIPGMLKGRLPPAEYKSALAGAVHGLGLALLIAQGTTGAYVMLGLADYSGKSMDVLLMFKLHEFCGILVWVFLAGHIFMTLYHLALGHRAILDIFQRIRIRWQ